MNRINRRRFSKTLTAASVCVLSGTSARAEPRGKRPRERPNLLYALSTGSWGRVTPPGKPLPLRRILDETAATGFNGVRLTGFPGILEDNHLDEDRLGDELKRRGLRFSTISFGGPYADAARHDEILRRARRVLALHRRYGATAAVFFPPGQVPRSRETKTLAACCRFFNRMGKMALKEYGIRMGLHNHTGSLVESQRQVEQFLNETDPRYVFCAWDSAHLLLGGCDVYETYKKSIERLVYTDFKDATLEASREDYVAPNGKRYAGDSPSGRFFNSIKDLGQGQIDFPALTRLLKQRGYRGWINHDLDTIRTTCVDSWRMAMHYIETTLDPIYQ